MCYNRNMMKSESLTVQDAKSGHLRTIHLRSEPNPNGVYTVTGPDVPGLVTEGRTLVEIAANVRDALRPCWSPGGS